MTLSFSPFEVLSDARQPTPEQGSLELPSIAETALTCARLGKGSVTSVFEPCARSAAIADATLGFPSPTLPDTVALLTPETTTHPIFGGTAQRSLIDGRSFGIADHQNRRGDSPPPTLVIKGGDPLNTEGVEDAVNRIPLLQIPGAGTLHKLEYQHDSCIALQLVSLSRTGSIAALPIPHSVRTIDTVPDEAGGQIPIRDFLNSPRYLSLDNATRRMLEIPPDIPLGDLMIDELGLQPAELLYMLDGPNIRCNELAGLLLYTGLEALPLNDRLVSDSLLPAFGIAMEQQGHSRDAVIRGAYKLLGDVWGIPLDGFLPVEPITLENYPRLLVGIRKTMQHSGVLPEILPHFVERVAETVALAHSHGYTFSPESFQLGGSLHPRNVTVSGTICDLDTLRFFEGDLRYFQKDLGELMLSVSTISRVLSFDPPGVSGPSHSPQQHENIVDQIVERYEDYLDLCCENTTIRDSILEATRSKWLYAKMLEVFYAG